MKSNRLGDIARRLTTISATTGSPSASDAELLGRFADGHDEAAFRTLVERHLPAVRAVCRSLLRDPNDVDDASQAAFLVLVRRVASIRNREAVGGWLYRVAWRVANRLRSENGRRTNPLRAGIDPDSTPAPPSAAVAETDTRIVLFEEVALLPEQYRLAVLTCYANGTTTAEAAKLLGWPKGTLLTRLAWARKRLRDRLRKRGVALTGGFLTTFSGRAGGLTNAELSHDVAKAGVAVVSTGRLAKGSVSERVSTLTEGVLRTMTGTKLKIAAVLALLAVALFGAGIGRFTAGAADGNTPADKKLPPLAAKPAGPATPATPEVEPAAAEPDRPAVAVGPGNDLVVRRPNGSFTKEVTPFGRATLTFTDTRIYLRATIQVEKLTFNVSADADYSLNRESMVYGIINSADVTGPFDGEEAAEIALMASALNDMPFAFRIRVDDDAIVIKDLRFGAFGSPMFTKLVGDFSSGGGEELMVMTGLVTGKYKADPNPDRNAPPPAPRGNQPQQLPKLKGNVRSSVAHPQPGAVVGEAIGPVIGNSP